MTTENQNTAILPKSTTTTNVEVSPKFASKLEERKGNAMKPLSLRPNRSVKKTTSLKPIGLKSR